MGELSLLHQELGAGHLQQGLEVVGRVGVLLHLRGGEIELETEATRGWTSVWGVWNLAPPPPLQLFQLCVDLQNHFLQLLIHFHLLYIFSSRVLIIISDMS